MGVEVGVSALVGAVNIGLNVGVGVGVPACVGVLVCVGVAIAVGVGVTSSDTVLPQAQNSTKIAMSVSKTVYFFMLRPPFLDICAVKDSADR